MVKNIGLILVVITLVNSATIKHKVFPEPKTFTESDKLLLLDPCQFEISHNQQNAKIDVEPIIKVYKSRIFGDALSCEKLAGIQYKKTLKINISVDLDQYLHPNIEETDESYCISLSEDEMLIEANQYPGLVHALETFSRLIKASKSNKGLHEIENTPITVKDAPRFPYRGIMLDSARHFIGVASIMRTIDAMVMSKMSVLHWHLIDDDSWSIESLSYPNLTSYAAFDQTQIYFKNEIQKVVSYATIRAIRIVPEFDNPGHTRSVGMDPSFLPLVAGFSIQDEYRMPSGPLINGGPPTGVLNPALNQSFTFLQNILTDFNTQFPDNLVHLGGDEVLFYC